MQAGECRCPKFDLADWRDREVTLFGHQFLAAPTPLFLHLPYRLHRDVETLCNRLEHAPYKPAAAPLILHRDGWLSGEVLVSVDAPPEQTPGLISFENVFYSRVARRPGFDAALREMPRFFSDLRSAQVGPIESMYFWYLSCPRCLLDRGPGQIILLARSKRILVSEPSSMAASAGCPAPRVVPCPGLATLR